MESSKRLEVTTVDEEGTLEAKTSVVLLGTVGSTTIRYRYSASIGIDLAKVEMSADGDSLVFLMPDPEILAQKYIDPEKGVNTAEEALKGASDILAEVISLSCTIVQTRLLT